MPWLHAFSSLLAFVLFHVVKYRKEVVMQNLRNSFPEKTDPERLRMARDFYLNLTDLLVETLKGMTIGADELRERVQVRGMEYLEAPLRKGHSVMALTSHHCNWEWMLLSVSAQLDGPVVAVYKELHSAFGEELMLAIRSRFDTEPVKHAYAPKKMIEWRREAKVYGMVADQAPQSKDKVPYFWTEFLHQETAFFRGPAVLAPKLQMAVIYASMRRTGRGRYALELFPMRHPPYSPDEDLGILHEYVARLTADLQAQPSNWLWSHKRWKQQRLPEIPFYPPAGQPGR
jgi:KDO2-lipid IV(A) lauroyltransferase